MATKFYLRSTAYGEPGTYPGSSALGGTPTVTATGASTNQWMHGTAGSSQTSTAANTDGTSNAQTMWHDRYISAPLAAQTISAQTITFSGAFSEGNANSNYNPTIYVGLWRPSTGAKVGDILAVGTITVAEPSTTQTAGSATGTSTSQTAQDGDVIVVETWRKSVAPSATTARANTIYWEGTTEASTTNCATFVNFANTLTFLARTASPSGASLTLTGDTPTVAASDNKTALPTAASLTMTGATPAVVTTSGTVSLPTAASLTLTGATPTVTAPAISLPTAASLTLTGATPAVATPVLSQPTAASLALSGATPAVAAPRLSQPTAASLALTGATPAVALPILSQPTAASLTVTGATPTVLNGAGVQVSPTAAALTLSGATPAVLAPVTVMPDAAALTLTGYIPGVFTPVSVSPGAAALLLAFGTPDVTIGTARAWWPPAVPSDLPRIHVGAHSIAEYPTGHVGRAVPTGHARRVHPVLSEAD